VSNPHLDNEEWSTLDVMTSVAREVLKVPVQQRFWLHPRYEK
jgi:hypothetical protein